ncbi:MAG: hypothetical protein QS721_11210 [Candidatus Endonucleobacter sp. (ex Gigantidas childressi)]|nr:hypothetical protein [Candidatus Endonucleobacter sp. (ex Gigantidas childressi)]
MKSVFFGKHCRSESLVFSFIFVAFQVATLLAAFSHPYHLLS